MEIMKPAKFKVDDLVRTTPVSFDSYTGRITSVVTNGTKVEYFILCDCHNETVPWVDEWEIELIEPVKEQHHGRD